ncbi:aryl hydrocarbon receptor protein 1 isoform X1 [Coccinella septempunctata]|uniref:aryl hydrocarbon receptor protein 1 isoform X1 n=3 Tax=Coccinella septempunctata TaxID=41139 RepID=UPI001D0965FE|nr:aryl hydrocarbon receptor protein 1 isoform X1 [Coccinella septempunctata]
MNQLGTVYATKRRRRNGKSLKPTPKDGITKSNPSKRHRERLNAELDNLASLLPFEQNILSKLDRLSILRLSVSYLRTKSYFQVVMHKDKDDGGGIHRSRDLTAFDHTPLDGEMFLQALNGFLMILTCEGEVFFATHSIEGYLGFHQSDIVHQSVYELVHSEDREELQRQLMWNSFLPPESGNMGLQDVLLPEHSNLLERSFTVRFRCLLDNTSGFLRLDIRGRVKVLHGQNRKLEEPPLALFAICTPFGPPSLLEIPQKEVMFKSKHKLDLSLVSMDQRGKMLLGYSDSELANMGGYDLVHYDDLAYVASAHQELLKTGASGMIAYRIQTKDRQWQWLQTSSRLVYKNSKPDFVISTHRPLMEEEGRDLLGKRTMDFKVSYLDAGLPNNYFTDSDQILSSASNVSSHSVPVVPSRVNKRYKTQLRDFLSTCRTKRKLSHTSNGQVTPPANNNVSAAVVPPMAAVEYIASDGCSAAYNMYASPYSTPSSDHSLPYMGHTNFQHTLYPSPATLDNRYLTATDNLFHQYRPLSTYYPDYHHSTASTPYVGNSFLDMSPRTPTVPTYDHTSSASPHHSSYRSAVMPVDEKLYPCPQVLDSTTNKYPPYVDSSRGYVVAGPTKCLDVSWPYSVSPSSGIIQPVQVVSTQLDLAQKPCGKHSKHSSIDGISPNHSSPPLSAGLITPKMEDVKSDGSLLQPDSSHHIAMNNSVTPQHFSPIPASVSEVPRQTVLMWGSNHIAPVSNRSPSTSHGYSTPQPTDACDSLANMTDIGNAEMCKWNGESNNKTETAIQNVEPESPQQHHSNHHNHHNNRVVMVL